MCRRGAFVALWRQKTPATSKEYVTALQRTREPGKIADQQVKEKVLHLPSEAPQQSPTVSPSSDELITTDIRDELLAGSPWQETNGGQYNSTYQKPTV